MGNTNLYLTVFNINDCALWCDFFVRGYLRTSVHTAPVHPLIHLPTHDFSSLCRMAGITPVARVQIRHGDVTPHMVHMTASRSSELTRMAGDTVDRMVHMIASRIYTIMCMADGVPASLCMHYLQGEGGVHSNFWDCYFCSFLDLCVRVGLCTDSSDCGGGDNSAYCGYCFCCCGGGEKGVLLWYVLTFHRTQSKHVRPTNTRKRPIHTLA